MKNIILFLTFILVSFSTNFAQDKLVPPVLQSLNDTVIVRNIDKFILGWNWGKEGKVLDSLLQINVYHDMNLNDTTIPSNYGKNLLLFQPAGNGSLVELVGGRHSNCIFNAQSLHLKAALQVNGKDFVPITSDRTGSVFGFRNKSNKIVVNNNRCELRRDKFGNNGEKVLSNIYDGSILRWLDFHTTNDSTIDSAIDIEKFQSFNGRRWYLSINLSTINANELNQGNLNDIILKIKIPYKLFCYAKTYDHESAYLYDNNRYIKFSKVPNSYPAPVLHIRSTLGNEFRGRARELRTLQILTDEFVITRGMLKYNNMGASNNSITLSAYFETNKDPIDTSGNIPAQFISNPCFKNDNYLNPYKIKYFINEVDVEVYYYGKVNVAIDWIRFETPRAQEILRGKRDREISDIIQNTIEKAKRHPAKPKIARFYGNDEFIPNDWFSSRYLNNMLDGLLTVEYYPTQQLSLKHINHALNFKENWNGDVVTLRLSTGVPYYKKGFVISSGNSNALAPSYNCTHLGYKGNNKYGFNFTDTLNSEYETFLYKSYEPVSLPLPNNLNIFEVTDWRKPNYFWNYSPLFNIEKDLHFYYYLNQELLYGDKPWIANMWFNHPGWGNDPDYGFVLNSIFGNSRQVTGEEARYEIMNPVILGCKGILHWIKEADTEYPSHVLHWLGFTPKSASNRNDIDNYLHNELTGGDYIRPNNNVFYPNCFNKELNYFDFGNMLENPSDRRLYIGIRSMRYEAYKLHSIIRRLEQNKRHNPNVYPHDLMDLRLVAWYGKGFTEMYSQHPEYGYYNLMYKYKVGMGAIRTAKLYQPNLTTQGIATNFKNVNSNCTAVHTLEGTDSAFYDISILAPKNSALGDNSIFYVGVQNRRTDPLIWDTVSKTLKFYSTAEFEDGCHSSNSITQNYFRDYFWKRLGCRLISIPFSGGYDEIGQRYTFQVEEILAQDSYFNYINRQWRSDDFCYKTNLYVPFSSMDFESQSVLGVTPNALPGNNSVFFLNAKYLPGEGKIFRFRKITANKIDNGGHSGKVLSTPFAFELSSEAYSSCPGSSDLYLRYDLVSDTEDSLEYDLLVVNNTQNDLKDLPILYRFLCEDVNINLNEFVNHSNLHPDCYDEYKLKRVSIIDSLFSQSQSQIAKIKVDKKAGLPELVYRFDVLSKDDKPCDQVFINSDNHIKEYYGKGYKGKKANTYQSDFVSSLEVNPNPANDKLIVNFVSSNVSSYKLNIYDINGGMVYSHPDAISSAGENKLTLDISILPVGLYNLSLEINNEQISRKFSINR